MADNLHDCIMDMAPDNFSAKLQKIKKYLEDGVNPLLEDDDGYNAFTFLFNNGDLAEDERLQIFATLLSALKKSKKTLSPEEENAIKTAIIKGEYPTPDKRNFFFNMLKASPKSYADFFKGEQTKGFKIPNREKEDTAESYLRKLLPFNEIDIRDTFLLRKIKDYNPFTGDEAKLKEIATHFCTYKKEIEQADAYGNTALFYAAEHGLSDLFAHLLSLGADATKTNSFRKTVWEVAEENNSREIISMQKPRSYNSISG